VEDREKLLNPKFDGLQKHLGKRKVLVVHLGVAMGEYYQIFLSQHKKNERIHVIQGPQLIQLVLNGGRAETKRNIFSLWQFSTF
jgi:hypothetical protein